MQDSFHQRYYFIKLSSLSYYGLESPFHICFCNFMLLWICLGEVGSSLRDFTESPAFVMRSLMIAVDVVISQSIHGDNAHVHRIPLPDMSKLCHCILCVSVCVCVESSSPRSDQTSGHLDLWLLLSQGGIEKRGDRRVVESQELIPISLELPNDETFWMVFCQVRLKKNAETTV